MNNKRKAPIYPIEPWNITEEAFLLENNYRNETIFALSNGYIGTRGTFEESYDFDIDTGLEGTFVNGFYESEKIRYGEWNFGFPENSQTILNLPNAKETTIFFGDEKFNMLEGSVSDYKRTLNLKTGELTRSLSWSSPKGKSAKLEFTRFVSFSRKNIMCIRIKITPLDFVGEITICSKIDGNVENHTRKTNPLVDYGPFGRHLVTDEASGKDNSLFYKGTTVNSELVMAVGTVHKISGGDIIGVTHSDGEMWAGLEYTIAGKQGATIVMDKTVAYTSSLDMEKSELKSFVCDQLQACSDIGFDLLEKEQKEYTARFWNSADVEITGDDAVQQGIRFNLFHTMQAAGRDGKTNIGAKGLTGEGYEGHFFWDTEIYILPVFSHTFPEIAKELINYRFEKLENARRRARILGHQKGAMYPWRTINGDEASTYLPLGTAQYHITADVAYSVNQYIAVSEDTEYLKERGAEILCETARVWADVGMFSEVRNGKYCICCVTGPDEYTAFVDNNFFTNLMARENIRYALNWVQWLVENDKSAYETLVKKIGLTDDERNLWGKIAENMYLPYDEKLGVFLQDDGLLMRKEWDDSHIPEGKKHLLYENYHPLYIWRQRMAKQADSILAMYLHSHLFDSAELERNYDFYQSMTLHHSSLSTCIFGIVACQIGRLEEAYDYFIESVRMDLDDSHNNVYSGIHAANMAGSWQAIVNGFAGVRTNNNALEITPQLPKKWESYSFRIRFRRNLYKITVSKNSATITLLEGKDGEVLLGGEKVKIKSQGDVAIEKI